MPDFLERLKTVLADSYAIEGQSSDVSHGRFTDRLPSREFTRGTTLAGVAVLTGILAWGGLLGPNDLDVNASFTVTHDTGVCTFVFRAKATQPEQTITYSYELGALRLIAPTTFGSPTLLEEDLGSFRDSFRRTWDFSLGTQSQIGRILRFRFTAGFFQLKDAISVLCPT